MIRDPGSLSSGTFDIVVIGGGIFGACVAWEAASRGLSVALMERGDFAHATSSNSYKIVHGGVRYLQHGDVSRMRASSRERTALLRVVPHLVQPMPIMVPTYGRGAKGKLVLRAGLGLYDLLTADRNRGIRDPTRRIPRARFISRSDALRTFPSLPPADLTGAAIFYDGQMYSPPRMVLSFVRSAAEAGAAVCNYVEAVDFIRDRDRVVGVRGRDLLGGSEFDVNGRMVVNATGPWAPLLLESKLGLASTGPAFSRDVGLVIDRQIHPGMGLACPTASRDAEAVVDRGGRHLFLLPWRDRTLVGVWHRAYSGSTDRIQVSESELNGFIDDANAAYPGLRLKPEEVGLVITGLILFGDEQIESEDHSFGRRSLVIDHEEEDAVKGLVSVVGVRATMARGVAETAVDRIAGRLGRKVSPSRTRELPVAGGDFETFETLLTRIEDSDVRIPTSAREALAHNHGSRFGDVLELLTEDPALGRMIPGSDTLRAEVVYAVRHEMACTLEDVVLRRTDLGTAGHPGERALDACARLMATEQGWSADRLRAEVEGVSRFYTGAASRRNFVPEPLVARARQY